MAYEVIMHRNPDWMLFDFQAVETYDWRLALPNLQARDRFFTRVQKRVELLQEIHEEKVWKSPLSFQYLKLTNKSDWRLTQEKHIAASYNLLILGCFLHIHEAKKIARALSVSRKSKKLQVFVVSHSWGDTVFRCFLSWISVKDPDWVERNLAVYANIAGPTLGVPKALSSFLSGGNHLTIMRSEFVIVRV